MKGHQYRRQLFRYSDWVPEQIARAKAYQTSYCNIYFLNNHFDQAIGKLQLCLFFYECLCGEEIVLFWYVLCIYQRAAV